jgi:hypothetical protein
MSRARAPLKTFRRPFALPRGFPDVRVEWQAHESTGLRGFEIAWQAKDKGAAGEPVVASGRASIRCVFVDEESVPTLASFAAYYCAALQLATVRGVPLNVEREKS